MADVELVLYGDARYTSPWVLSVWTALREKGLAFRMATLDAGRVRTGGATTRTRR